MVYGIYGIYLYNLYTTYDIILYISYHSSLLLSEHLDLSLLQQKSYFKSCAVAKMTLLLELTAAPMSLG